MVLDTTPAPEPSFREQVEAAEAQQPSETVLEQPQDEVSADGAEQQPELDADGQPTKGPVKMVPHESLHEERKKRQRAEQQRDADRQAFQTLQNQQVEMMRYIQSLTQPQAPPVPTLTEDPLGNIGATVHQTAAELANMKKDMADRDQAQQAVSRRQQFEHAVSATEQQFAAQTPDYFEAITWAKDKKLAEYQAVGLSEGQANDRIMREVNELAWDAIQRGESPAVVGYRLAQAIGYQPKQGNAQQKLEMQRNGRAASTPSGGSGQGGGRLSLDALNKLAGDDFLAATAGGKWKQLMDR